MSTSTIASATQVPQLNPDLLAAPAPPQGRPASVSIGRVRRMCKNRNLRLVRDRSKGDYTKRYQLQSFVVIAGQNFELTLETVVAICERLGSAGAR